MAFECKYCNRKFVSEESLAQHIHAKHFEKKSGKKMNLKKPILGIMFVLIVLFSVLTVYSYSQKPGKFDEFAKCLTEKGIVVYGNDFCSYTVKQLNYFGKSKEHLNYVKCIDNEALCNEKGVSVTPTWEYEGNVYSGVQTFERLSSLTGCEI